MHIDAESAEAAMAEGDAAYSAARDILAIPDARFAIIDADYTAARWGDRSPDGAPIYVWRFRKANSRALAPPAYLLRHEIGHDLFIRYLVPSTRSGQYGGDAPDWLDEMAAVAFEGEMLRTNRRRAAARYAREAQLIRLRTFLTMVHPEMAAGSIPAWSDQQVTVFEALSDQTPQFYTIACAFYDYLVSRTGNAAIVAELAAAFRNGADLDQWIIVRTGHGDRASGMEALNADFLAWIASDARYGGDAGL